MRLLLSLSLTVLWSVATADAQTITSVRPLSCLPGQTARLTVQGTQLDDSLRVAVSSPDIVARVQRVEPTQAIVEVTLPADSPLGPFGMWFACSSGPLRQQMLMADDLPPVRDNGENHSIQTAQSIPSQCAVEGVCDASTSDFYRLTVSAGQRIAFEVHSQALLSAMDPVLRLLDADGHTLHLSDDTDVGPDGRFGYQFDTAGDYWLAIHDSRSSAAGAPYHLRIGDFPLVTHCFPLAVQEGQVTTLQFVEIDAAGAHARDVLVAPGDARWINVSTRRPDGKSSAWVPLIVSRHKQVHESPTLGILTLPVGISGQLAQPHEVDSYRLQGAQGESVRVVSRTRSVGCPTLLQMTLLNAAAQQVAQTQVSEADQWSFDFTFPADGEYRLEVVDLLRRGGPGFGYWIEVTPAGSFAVALKADPVVPDVYPIEAPSGACALELQIERFGYDGEISLSLASASHPDQSTPPPGIRLLNPRIPPAATEARVYLVADASWQAGHLELMHLVAQAADNPANRFPVSSFALHRAKTPFVLKPADWSDGTILLAAVPHAEVPFAMEPVAPVQFARPLKSHTAKLTLKRLQPQFTAGVTVLGNSLPDGWNVTAEADQDTYALTFTQGEPVAGEPVAGEPVEGGQAPDLPDGLPLLVYGEFNGRGRMESYQLPVEWIDPLQISLEFPTPVVPGGSAVIRAQMTRRGDDPQPVTLKFAELPPGVTAPPVSEVAADQSHCDIELQIASDASLDEALWLKLSGASKYCGQDFEVVSQRVPLPLVESPRQLAVYPAAVVLEDPRGRQQLVVTGSDSEQTPRDWTRFARMTSADPSIAAIEDGTVFPKSDGDTVVLVQVGAQQLSIPVRVRNSNSQRPVQFEAEVLVGLSKQGCNSGACHGSPSGKGGFRLSLRAFDKQLDELTLIREDFGRRVNTLEPQQSLLLHKPLMKVAHGGGKRLHPEDEAYPILLDWIAGGAAADPPGTPRVNRLEVHPSQKRVLSTADGGQQLAVTAYFSDGSHRDVTHLAAYETSDGLVATVDERGFVTPHHRGEVAILVRYLEFIESAPLMFVSNRENFTWQAPPPNNYVDTLVNYKLQQLQYLPSETCNDGEFLRRVSLDVLGVLPTIDETKAFLSDPSADKRARLIDSLLDRDEYARFWALKWGDLLRMTSKLVGDEGVYKYHRWVEESLHNNMPYDEFARQLLTGTGSTLANPPANFYRTAADMNECVETVSQVFLGARLQCAKCHNHPFERWTQDNYYGLGAFFHRVQRRLTQRPGEMFVYTSFSGDVTQPRTGQVMAPWLPQVGSIETRDDVDRRLAFTEWLVSPDNPYFARIEVNRIWSQLFARGIVEPIDDFRDSNPPSNDQLLDALAKDFVESGFDRKHLLRVLLNSRTYQASFQPNDSNREDGKYFSHQEPRLLAAEQLLDAINHTLSLDQNFGHLPQGTRATQLPAPDLVKVDFLKVFGQPERSTVCACERADDSNLGMALELFNGPTIHQQLRAPNNRFRQTLQAGGTAEQAITELYLAALCRWPSQFELKAATDHCKTNREEPALGLEDVGWALFNTDEFLFQH
jgi:hypothetical protein